MYNKYEKTNINKGRFYIVPDEDQPLSMNISSDLLEII